MYRAIAEASVDERAKKHVMTLLDSFDHNGPNGNHRCLVFEPMGPSASKMLDPMGDTGVPEPMTFDFNEMPEPPAPGETGMPGPVPPAPSATEIPEPPASIAFGIPEPMPPGASERSGDMHFSPAAHGAALQPRSMLKQLLLGLHCLHSCKIAHGDLNPGNMLFSIRPLTDQDLPSLVQHPTEGQVSPPVKRLDGERDRWAPEYLCLDRPLTGLVDLDESAELKLSDLGAAFPFDNPPRHDDCTTPVALRAPEIILGGLVSYQIDIWSFGCLIYEFLTGQRLFQVSGWAGIPLSQNNDDHLLQMFTALGHFPPAISAMWPRYDRYIAPNLEIVRSDVGPGETPMGDVYVGQTLEQMFDEQKPPDMGVDEAKKVLALIRGMLQYEPALRPSTGELLEDEWFKSID